MGRIAAFAYGIVCYVMFLAVFLYAIAFVGDFLVLPWVPRTIDSPPGGPLSAALGINGLLLAVFAVQHSVMARPTFKKWWTQFIPQPIERATYLLFSNLVMILLFWLWQPIDRVIWDVQQPVGRGLLYALFAGGWLLVLVSTLLINHLDLFGMRQVWLYLRGKEYTSLGFVTPGPYKLVRHPLYVGWITAFWAIPTMTAGHLMFALGTTAYIVVAIWFEERNLVTGLGEPYASYRRRVPMLVPRFFRRNVE